TPARVVGTDGRTYAGAAGEELAAARALARRAAVDLAAAGWSLREIAGLVGVSSSTIGRWLAAVAAAASELEEREAARRRVAELLGQTRTHIFRPTEGVSDDDGIPSRPRPARVS